MLAAIPIAFFTLVFLATGGPNAFRRVAGKTDARKLVRQLKIAVTNYHHDYGKHPLPRQGVDIELETTPEFIAILTGNDPDLNPYGNVYMIPPDGRRSHLTEDGTLVDQWGQPYQLRLDGDADGKIQNPDKTSPIKTLFAPVLVWSRGPDQDGQGEGQNNDTWKDNILSWE